MEKDIDSKKINQILRISSKVLKKLYILIFIIAVYITILILSKLNVMLFIQTFLKILSPLFIGIVIAWLLKPLVNYITNKGMNKFFSVTLIYIIILFICYLLIKTLIPIFTKETSEFIKLMPNFINEIFDISTKTFKNIDLKTIKEELSIIINNLLVKTSKDLPFTLVSIVKSISSILMGIIVGFYLLIYDSSYLTYSLNKYLKKDTYDFILNINSILRNYVKGILLSSLLVFILSTIIFYIFDLDAALLLGFICGITNIIPFIGPYIGAVIPVLIGFTKSITFGILILVMIFIIQTIEGNIIHPIIMSKSVKIHPVSAMVSLLIFGYFFGIIGMIIAVPLMAIIKELYFYIMKKYKNYKKNISR